MPIGGYLSLYVLTGAYKRLPMPIGGYYPATEESDIEKKELNTRMARAAYDKTGASWLP